MFFIYFIAKVYYKNAFIRNVIVIKLFYNENDKNNENVIFFTSYFYIKFIILFKYLTLYYILNFDL